MLLDADSVEQTLDDSLHWLGQLLPTPPTINFPWLDELTATAKAKKDGVTQFYESRIAQGFYSAAQAAGVGDLTPGGFAVKWEELAIIGDGGVRLKAVVAYPKAGAAEAARFPVVVLCNSWVMNWWEYAMKQQEWASAGYVVLMYVARGWWDSEGSVTAAGEPEQRDAVRVLDTLEARAADWGADTSRIATCGVSYGGGLAALTAANDARVKAVICLSAWGNIQRALDGQAAPNLVWYDPITLAHQPLGTYLIKREGGGGRRYEFLKLTGSPWLGMGNLDPSVPPIFAEIMAGNLTLPLLEWARLRSPESHLHALCGGGRATPVFLSNNAEDRLFAPDGAFIYRQALQGAGCRVELMLHEGIHAMAEIPGMLGLSDSIAVSLPLWGRVFAFLQYHLKAPSTGVATTTASGAAPAAFSRVYLDYYPTSHPCFGAASRDIDIPAETWRAGSPLIPVSFQVREPRASVYTNNEPSYEEFESWPSARVLPTAYKLAGSHLVLGLESEACGVEVSLMGGKCQRHLAFGVQTGFHVGVPVVGPFIAAGWGNKIYSRVEDINTTAAGLWESEVLEAPLRLCGIPNATIHVTPSMKRFQLAAFLFSVDKKEGLLDLLTFAGRGVWERGADPAWAQPGEVSWTWQADADGGGPLTVRMPAICTDVPAGRAIGLGLSLHHQTFQPANADVALRVALDCNGGDSVLELPVVTSP
ncbi:hypothetical protein EMIHUDRAFT_102851 [Emiliania huxleyi CCMP1516]|uniref:Xaa-Pro dipeptidyl-peptidase-like domain-containing protein n=2 Tax=Emiliania huxleyi TaxID=2903 RepID=A0A0D3IYB1_EMIH1|nr:hypothetical protein EMIHUDRAFT_102851 [Emiliania huxleyi CCMP1516]EOD16246.1 hypothetical protein EMIHUDRAFT_102851 [Emiliania huxleyi CCMP1516]|eukprot:XP_005768675.1 hypothetical protein EMIHUDRAFT_102851 [Emiliania huxleyi CCMP1516]